MSIAVEKLKRSSARWYLVRLNPSRHITSLLVSGGGGLYSLNIPYAISSITRNGVTLTETSSIPGSNDNWYHDESTGTLTIRLASAPSTTSNILILNYYIFLTTSEGQQTYETPTNSATPIRVWEPLVSDVASIRKTIPNAIFGVFTIDDFQLSLNNSHNDFQKYLTPNDSFKDSPALVWICANSNENISLVYTGKCQAPSVTSEEVSINIYDSFSKLNQPAYFGDTADEAFYYKTASSFPSMDGRSHGTLNRLIIGNSSPYRETVGFPLAFFQFESRRLDSTGMPDAVNISYNVNYSNLNNRTWGIGRLFHDGSGNPAIASTLWGSRTGQVSSGKSTIFVFTPAVFSTMNVQIGDSVKITESPDTIYGLVVAINFNSFVPEYGVEVHTESVPTFPGFTSAATITSFPCVSIVINQDGIDFLPIYERDYSVSYDTTSGSNMFAKITFVNGFESNSLMLPYIVTPTFKTLNPNSDRVYFRVRPNIFQIPMHKHGQVMKRIAQNAGIETVDSTFSDADTDLNVGVLMSIPTAQEFDYENYLKYAEDVASSSLGFMFSNSEGKAEYHLLAAPTSTDLRNDDYILERSLNMEINYQDIYTRIISYNLSDKSEAEELSLSITSEENAVSRYLYNVNRPRQLVHVLDNFTGRIDYYLSVLSNPITTYNFETATIDIESDINDDLVLESDFVPGGSVTVKVIGTIRDIDRTRILAITYGEL
jgi:hypothetical protein